MNTQQAITAAAIRFDFEPSQVVTARLEVDCLVVLVNRGIGGIPKYRIQLDKLRLPEPDVETQSEPALDPADMTVSEIKTLDLPQSKWQQMLEMERAGKARSSAINHIESELE